MTPLSLLLLLHLSLTAFALPGPPDGFIREGQLEASKKKVQCKVSEANIPVVGAMAWNFEMHITGWGDKGSGCGGGVLDNLRGSCHGTLINNWGCDKLGGNVLKLTFQTPKVHDGTCINAALRQASWQTWGQKDLVCPYDYKSSTVKAVFSGLSMAIPIPGAGAVVGAAKAVGTAIATGVKAATTVAKAGVQAAKGVAKNAIKSEVKHQAKDQANKQNDQRQQKKQRREVRSSLDCEEPVDFIPNDEYHDDSDDWNYDFDYLFDRALADQDIKTILSDSA